MGDSPSLLGDPEVRGLGGVPFEELELEEFLSEEEKSGADEEAVQFQEIEIDGMSVQGVEVTEVEGQLENPHGGHGQDQIKITYDMPCLDRIDPDFVNENSLDLGDCPPQLSMADVGSIDGIAWEVIDVNRFYGEGSSPKVNCEVEGQLQGYSGHDDNEGNSPGHEIEAPLDLCIEFLVKKKKPPPPPPKKKQEVTFMPKKVRELKMKRPKVFKYMTKRRLEEQENAALESGDIEPEARAEVNLMQKERERAKLYKSLSNYPVETITWLLEHFEPLPDSLVPRSQIYFHYIQHCDQVKVPLVNCASFGKLIHNLFPDLKTRRLGTRGNSKYHYAGIKIKPHSKLINLPWIHLSESASAAKNASNKWKESEMINITEFFAPLGSVKMEDFPPLPQELTYLPQNLTHEDIKFFHALYRELCEKMLDKINQFKVEEFHRLWIEFWSRGQLEDKKFTLEMMETIVCLPEMSKFIQLADVKMYQALLDILIPDPLVQIPGSIKLRTASFILPLEVRMAGELGKRYPEEFVQSKIDAVRGLQDSLKLKQTLSHLVDYIANVFDDPREVRLLSEHLYCLEMDSFGSEVKTESEELCENEAPETDYMYFPTLWPKLLRGIKDLVGFHRGSESGISKAASLTASLEGKYVGGILCHYDVGDDDLSMLDGIVRSVHQFSLSWNSCFVQMSRHLNMESFESAESFFCISNFMEIYLEYLVDRRLAKIWGRKGVPFLSLQGKPEEI